MLQSTKLGSEPAIEVNSINQRGRNADVLLYYLVWLYIVLWIFEGGLRRWVLPQFSNQLLLIRDPLALAIYSFASTYGLIKINVFFKAICVLAFLELLVAAMGHCNFLVAVYGFRCDFLHVPMIFITARSFTKPRLEFLFRVMTILSIPYTLLLISQFYSPQSAWVNRGVGGDLAGAGFSGALDRFRPPGTFSFITGPAALYPIFAACLFATWSRRLLPPFLCYLSLFAIAIAVPISISRLLFGSVLIVALTCLADLIIRREFRIRPETVFLGLSIFIVLTVGMQFSVVDDGLAAFTSRWTTSTTEEGGAKDAIFGRLFEHVFGVFLDPNVGLLGAGTGFSTNVGQMILTGEVGFGLSEGESGRLIYDNGLLVGLLVLLFRVFLGLWIGTVVLRSYLKGNSVGLVLYSTAILHIVMGQWGQPATQGATTIAAGLTLAAVYGESGRQLR